MSKNNLEEQLAQISKTSKYDKVKSMIWTMIMPIIAGIVSVIGMVCFFLDFKENIKVLMGLFPFWGFGGFVLLGFTITQIKEKRKRKNEENTRI